MVVRQWCLAKKGDHMNRDYIIAFAAALAGAVLLYLLMLVTP